MKIITRGSGSRVGSVHLRFHVNETKETKANTKSCMQESNQMWTKFHLHGASRVTLRSKCVLNQDLSRN